MSTGTNYFTKYYFLNNTLLALMEKKTKHDFPLGEKKI